MKNKFTNVHDITLRRTELKYEIKIQEERLSQDFEAYHDEWEAVCNTWNFFFNRKSRSISSFQTSSRLFQYVNIGFKIASKIIRFFKKKNNNK